MNHTVEQGRSSDDGIIILPKVANDLLDKLEEKLKRATPERPLSVKATGIDSNYSHGRKLPAGKNSLGLLYLQEMKKILKRYSGRFIIKEGNDPFNQLADVRSYAANAQVTAVQRQIQNRALDNTAGIEDDHVEELRNCGYHDARRYTGCQKATHAYFKEAMGNWMETYANNATQLARFMHAYRDGWHRGKASLSPTRREAEIVAK